MVEIMSKSSSEASIAKGRRYSRHERETILAFIDRVNAERGRGGQSAAAKKYNLAPLTVTKWVRYRDVSPTSASSRTSDGPIGDKIRKLQELHDQIAKTESKLGRLRNQFDFLKDTL